MTTLSLSLSRLCKAAAEDVAKCDPRTFNIAPAQYIPAGNPSAAAHPNRPEDTSKIVSAPVRRLYLTESSLKNYTEVRS